MSNHLDFRRGRVACFAIAFCLVFAAVPIAAEAAAVNLATAQPFVVLSGAGVTNTGPSVLNGDLGVSPGTALSGFSAPATVNGATHANDEVASQAQADLTTAYNVAAGQPIPPGNELTGTNLGQRTLDPGVYGYSSSAQLTGQLTLDAHGDPNAQFVFVIGSSLTTESASSVVLVNGASPCNVFWKVGESATLGSTTVFAGNLMALTSISLNNGVNVVGRMLARNGEVTLINDVLTRPECATGSSQTPTGSAPGGSAGTPAAGTAPSSTNESKSHKEHATGKKPPKDTTQGSASLGRGKRTAAGVPATVKGHRVKEVHFTDNGVPIGVPGSRHVRIPSTPGVHVVTAKVTFTDSTKPKTMTFRFRVPTPILHPRHGNSQFTG